jgi:hypothetical protein
MATLRLRKLFLTCAYLDSATFGKTPGKSQVNRDKTTSGEVVQKTLENRG